MLDNRRGLFCAAAALALLFVGGVRQAAAQDAVIRGTITSERGEKVTGANVFIEELRIGVATSATGQYVLPVPGARVRGQQVVLRVRSIGFKPTSRIVTLTAGDQIIDLTVAYDVNLLEAIVVTGTLEATAAVNVPFAVGNVDASQMPVAAANPLSQLQGKVPGVNIVSASGRPGAQPAVILRAPTSMNASGRGQDPLYIVDGVIINGNLPDLNPSDIENVQVVKGAAGASMYGARAGNGVINITTKSGRRALEGVKFNVRSEGGVSDIERDFGLARYHALVTDETGTMFCEAVTGQPLCARTFDYWAEQARVNNAPGDFALGPKNFPIDPGSTIAGQPLRQRFQVQAWPGTSYNAVNQLVTPKPFTNNSMDLTGRFGSTMFFLSGSNLRQEGAIRFLNGFTRSSFRMNVDQAVGSDLNLALRASYSRSTQDGINQEEGGNAFFRLTRVPAIVNIMQTDTLDRLYIRSNLQGGGSQNQNPLSQLKDVSREDVTNRFIGGLTATYAPVNWFSLDANFSYDLRRSTAAQIVDKGFRTTTNSPSGTFGFLGSLFRSATGRESFNGSVNATFKHDFNPDLRSRYTLRYLFERRDFNTQSASGNQLSIKGVTDLTNTLPATRLTNSDANSIRQIGVFAGAGLQYKDRYILDALVRRDGSSLFGVENRWATFGRASLAWRVAQEEWWFVPQVSEMKLRASVGTAGGSPRFDAQYETFSIGAGGIPTMVTLGNRNLRPEVNREIELGVDMEIAGRYGFSATYARTRIKDQILPVPMPASTGFQRRWLNAAVLENRTWELSLNVPLIQQRDFQWSARVIYDKSGSWVTKLNTAPFYFGADLQGTGNIFQAVEGERFGTFYGHYFLRSCSELPAGFQSQCGGPTSAYQRNDEGFLVWVGAGNSPRMGITNNLWETQLTNTATDTTLSPWGATLNWGMPILMRGVGAAVRNMPLGNALPDYRFAITQDVRFKGFTVYALLDASIGQDVWNQGFHWAHLDFLSEDVDQVGKSVETAKPIGYYWRTSPVDGFTGLGGFYDVLQPNNYTVESGSYAKLRELLVSYHVGPVGGWGDWEVSVVGRNLWTITGYRGFDPEVGLSGGNAIQNAGSAAINAVDAFTFPNKRSFTFALSTSF